MKAAFAIMFALVLGVTQAALPVPASASLKRACRSCACPGRACCFSERTTSQTPLAPIRQVSTEQVQLLATQLARFVFSVPAEPVSPFSSHAQFSPTTALPIYYRN